jgi:hypothetical protein
MMKVTLLLLLLHFMNNKNGPHLSYFIGLRIQYNGEGKILQEHLASAVSHEAEIDDEKMGLK